MKTNLQNSSKFYELKVNGVYHSDCEEIAELKANAIEIMQDLKYLGLYQNEVLLQIGEAVQQDIIKTNSEAKFIDENETLERYYFINQDIQLYIHYYNL